MAALLSEGTGLHPSDHVCRLAGIACNIPLNYVLMFGKLGVPAMGAVGAGWATAMHLLLQLLALTAWIVWRPRYAPFALFARWSPPNRREIGALVWLGLPIGSWFFSRPDCLFGSALLIGTLGGRSRSRPTRVAMNYAGLMFMVPSDLLRG